MFIECEVVWRANLGHRYQLLGAAVQSTATTLEQCAMLCRQSTSCIVYQVRMRFDTIYKNSSVDEIANVNFYAVRPEDTRIR